MKRLGLLLIFLALTRDAGAQEFARVQLKTEPRGGRIVELMPDGSQVTVVEASKQEVCSWMATTTDEHLYRFQRTHFDDFDLRLRWDAASHHWRVLGRRYDDRVDLLNPQETFFFSRTLRLNVTPADATPYVVSADLRAWEDDLATRSHVDPDTKVVQVAGAPYEVRQLLQDSSGRITIPAAQRPPRLVLTRAAFATKFLNFVEGELDAPGDRFPREPVRLDALYGPFSYWQFTLGLGVALTAVAWLWLPRALRARRLRERDHALAAQVAAHTSGRMPGLDDLPPLLGQVLDSEGGQHFLVLQQLGAGGMGAVFEVRATGSNLPSEDVWAAKILFKRTWEDREFRARFHREIKICCSLQHPGIVKLLDWGIYRRPLTGSATDCEEWPFMIMERVQGRELRQFIGTGSPVPWPQAVTWTVEALRALSTAHARGIVHRDLKPENLMITGKGHVKVMDFGVARQLNRDTLTQTDVALGTPRYMSPEHLDAKTVTPASDIYSMGVILYEMLSGTPPFEAPDPWALLVKMMRDTPRALSSLRDDLPPGLEAVVAKMMARQEADRYASAQEAMKALGTFTQ